MFVDHENSEIEEDTVGNEFHALSLKEIKRKDKN